MQQTTYAAARSKDPRNQIFINNSSYVDPRARNPFINRPQPTSGGDVSLYQKPASQMWRNDDVSDATPTTPVGLQNAVSQAQEGQEAMLNPSFLRQVQEAQSQRQTSPLAGIDIGEPNSDQSNSVSNTPLPVSPPPAPLAPTEDGFTQEQVDNAKKTTETIFKGQSTKGGVGAATNQDAQQRIQSDIQAIAESKKPYQTWQNLQKQPFYQNSSFYTGLMGVGLAIMSGKDPMEAYQAGSAMSEQDDIKKQLSANRDALIDQGYSPDSVASAVAMGDPRLLKMREMSPEQQAAMQDQRWQRQYDITRQDRLADQVSAERRDEARQNRSLENQLALQEARYKLMTNYAGDTAQYKVRRTSPKWEPTEELGGITPNLRDKLQQSYRPVINVISQRNKWMGPVEASMQMLDGTGDVKQQQAAQRASVENLTKLIQGGLASIGRDTMEELTGDPDWIDSNLNKLSMMAGQAPTKENIKWLKALGETVQKIDRQATVLNIGPLTDSLVIDSGLKPENAIRAANAVFAPAGVRMTMDDYKKWAKSHSKVYNQVFPQKNGALSSAQEDLDSWMLE